MQQTKLIVEAAERLISEKGARFTTQEIVKEAGVALQTFYRHFVGKDQLLLAVIEDMITRQATVYENTVRDITDPVARLRSHVTGALSSLDASGRAADGPRFITAEHWRLQQTFPAEVERATRPFADLVARELRAAREAGILTLANVDLDAALIANLVMAVYHRYAFIDTDRSAAAIGEHVWSFCLAGLRGGGSGALGAVGGLGGGPIDDIAAGSDDGQRDGSTKQVSL
jgi:AcrR family transcriptional regulator